MAAVLLMLSDVTNGGSGPLMIYCVGVIERSHLDKQQRTRSMFNTVLSLSAALVVIVGLPGLIESTESQLIKMEATRSEIIRAALR